MRTLFLLLLMIFASNWAIAQVEKGDITLTVNGSYSKTGDVSTNGLINAKFGRYFTKNIELGIKPQLQFGKDYSGVGFGGYATYNFLTKNAKFLPYVGAEYSSLSVNFEAGDYSQSDIGFYGGSKLFLNEALNVDFGISVLSNMSNSLDADLGSTVMFNVGVGFIFGKLK